MSEIPVGTVPAEKNPNSGMKFYVKIAGTLFLITVIVALLLSLVNSITEKPIADRAEAERVAARSAVIAGADAFSEVDHQNDTVVSLLGAYAGTTQLGYCVEVKSSGFGGDIELMVGVDLNGEVTGVLILKHAETPGVGSKAASPDFLGQFSGKSGTLQLGSGVNAISGATVSSKAVTAGVNKALAAVANLNPEGGMGDGEAN